MLIFADGDTKHKNMEFLTVTH